MYKTYSFFNTKINTCFGILSRENFSTIKISKSLELWIKTNSKTIKKLCDTRSNLTIFWPIFHRNIHKLYVLGTYNNYNSTERFQSSRIREQLIITANELKLIEKSTFACKKCELRNCLNKYCQFNC